jgi:hypothetical protein
MLLELKVDMSSIHLDDDKTSLSRYGVSAR